jgi:hypothetical protein
MVRTRTRMLTFRVTEEEFERLQAASNVSGARCLSDFLRKAALQGLAQGTGNPQSTDLRAALIHPWVTRQLLSFEERVNHLEMGISDLLASATRESKPAKE